MSAPNVELVFKTSGVPLYTFVEPREYTDLLLNLRSSGRGLVIEGPSGIGKTTAVETALERLGISDKVTKLSARRPKDVEYIDALPTMSAFGVVIIDDFHKLAPEARSRLADLIKILADEDSHDAKVIAIGINKAGENLIRFAHDLVNRIDVIRFETNPDEKVKQLLEMGARELNIDINVIDDVVQAAQGSFYLAQMFGLEVCKRAGVLERSDIKTRTTVSFESVKADVWERLSQVFRERTERFCRGAKMKREGRAPYLHVLRWLAEGTEWTLPLRDAMRTHPGMRGSVGQVVEKGYLGSLVENDAEIAAVLHYDEHSAQLTVQDPQYLFYIRNIAWRELSERIGFVGLDFPHKYDFALSFAGEDREIAQMFAHSLEDAEVEVFYDFNEQHRILASDVEEYLRPIYQSEARFVIALLGPNYPKKIWTKFESEQFRGRLGHDCVIPVWFTTAPPGLFDETRRIGGITLDPVGDVRTQVSGIVELLMKKLGTERQAPRLPGL
ncbi:MAG: TIR domain-containing protein [Fimbriimonadaceae bacterium]|nr:TIR domain-containing protein [Fimbriimonadaceae bacterium]